LERRDLTDIKHGDRLRGGGGEVVGVGGAIWWQEEVWRKGVGKSGKEGVNQTRGD